MKNLEELLDDCHEMRTKTIILNEDKHPVSADDIRDIIHYLHNLDSVIMVLEDMAEKMKTVAEALKK